MNYLPLFGRICLCLIFFNGAFGNFTTFSETQARMAEMGLPIPSVLLLGNIVFQIVGAISLLLGLKVKWGAVILIIFLIPTTVIFHPFWVNPGESIAFFKNLGLIGGLLLLIYTGAGAVSVDRE
ncbi:MAG: DoxX family protein [Halothece sp. Uz-M2-17]|nr:DoxX family protein [Halothece sp. Uz-M2-17]